MNKLKNYFIAGLTVAVLAGGFYIKILKDNINTIKGEKYALMAANDTLKTENENIKSKLSFMDADNDVLFKDKAELLAIIKEQKGKILSLTNTVVEYEKIIASGDGEGSTHVDSTGVTVYRVGVNYYKDHVRILGYTEIPPATYKFSIERDPLDLTVAITEMKDRTFRIYAQPSYGTIKNLKSNFIKYDEKWYEKIMPVISMSYYTDKDNRFGVAGGLNYNDYIFMVGYNSKSIEYRVAKQFNFFRK